MYFWSWLILLNMSYKYNENIACTGISILYPYLETGGSTWKMEKIRCNYFSILGLYFWNFPQCIFSIFGSYAAIFGNILGVRGVTICDILAQNAHGTDWEQTNLDIHQKWVCTYNFCKPNFQDFCQKWWRKELFCIVGTSWMGWGRVKWDWHMEMSYLTTLNPQLLKNIAYVGSFKLFSVQLFFYKYFATRPRASLTAVTICSEFFKE